MVACSLWVIGVAMGFFWGFFWHRDKVAHDYKHLKDDNRILLSTVDRLRG